MSLADDYFVEAARERGPIASGCYRIVTLETDGRLQVTEAKIFKDAVEYADEAASEGGPRSRIYDARFRVIYCGRHYLSNALVADRARELGPLAPGCFRTVVVDSDPAGRERVGASHRDFPSLAEAAAFADEQAALSDGEPLLALVFDVSFKAVHVGLRRGE